MTLIEIKDKYSVLGELIAKSEELKNNKDNMLNVNKAIKQLRTYFQNL